MESAFNPSDRYVEIRAELMRRRYSIAMLARECGLTAPHVREVLMGNRHSDKVDAALHRIVGRTIAQFAAQAPAASVSASSPTAA